MRKVVKYNPYYEDDEIMREEKAVMTKDMISLIRESAVFQMEMNPHWRKGQAIFNCAFDIDPHAANALRGSALDCFHNDDLIDEFLANL